MHGAGLAEAMVMNSFNLLDPNRHTGSGFTGSLLGVNWGIWAYFLWNVWTIDVAPVVSWKSKSPFMVQVGYVDYLLFPYSHCLSSSHPYITGYSISFTIRKIQSCRLLLNNDSQLSLFRKSCIGLADDDRKTVCIFRIVWVGCQAKYCLSG